jgi:hypothetical protein
MDSGKSSVFDQFEFVSDPRDGEHFDVVKILEKAASRGSKQAFEMLERLEYRNSNPEYAKPHSQVKAEIEDFEARWEVIRAFDEAGEGDEDEIEDQQELVEEIIEWIEWLEGISPASYKFIFDKYINFVGYGAFGQGNGYAFDLDLWLLVTNPVMPRDLLWEFSVGNSAQLMSLEDTMWVYPNRWIGMAPRYVNRLAISPVASTNLLKAINEKYSDTDPDPFHFHTMLNANADIELLKGLDPASVRDNLVFELKLIESSDQNTFDDELEEMIDWILKPYFATASGSIEFDEAEEAWGNSFSNPFGIGALLIAMRMSEEFKIGNADINVHLKSDSIILRTLLYYNPSLTKDQQSELQDLGIIELDIDVAEMYKSAWNPENPTMVM